MAILRHIAEFGSAYNVLVTFMLLLVTGAYVILTWRLLNETRQMRSAQTEPLVYVCAVLTTSSVSLEIRNIGAGVAYGVTFTLEPDLRMNEVDKHPSHEELRLSELGPLKHGIPCFPPGAALEIPLVTIMHGWKPPAATFQLTARYRDGSGKQHCKTYPIGFGHLTNVSFG